MTKAVAGLLIFLGGFAVMVLEIVGARFLARDFGSSSYVWISQIGVVLVALAAGYAIGGTLADKFKRAAPLALPLCLAGVVTFLIPNFTPPVIGWIVRRHPLDQPIPLIWQKLDPVLGSTVVFFLPCVVLALLSPYVIRIAARRLETVGTISGFVYSASTVGSIAGVFLSGYVLVDYMGLATIFRAAGVCIFILAGLCLWLDWCIKREKVVQARSKPNHTKSLML
jgi:MFS family permease